MSEISAHDEAPQATCWTTVSEKWGSFRTERIGSVYGVLLFSFPRQPHEVELYNGLHLILRVDGNTIIDDLEENKLKKTHGE